MTAIGKSTFNNTATRAPTELSNEKPPRRRTEHERVPGPGGPRADRLPTIAAPEKVAVISGREPRPRQRRRPCSLHLLAMDQHQGVGASARRRCGAEDGSVGSQHSNPAERCRRSIRYEDERAQREPGRLDDPRWGLDPSPEFSGESRGVPR